MNKKEQPINKRSKKGRRVSKDSNYKGSERRGGNDRRTGK